MQRGRVRVGPLCTSRAREETDRGRTQPSLNSNYETFRRYETPTFHRPALVDQNLNLVGQGCRMGCQLQTCTNVLNSRVLELVVPCLRARRVALTLSHTDKQLGRDREFIACAYLRTLPFMTAQAARIEILRANPNGMIGRR